MAGFQPVGSPHTSAIDPAALLGEADGDSTRDAAECDERSHVGFIILTIRREAAGFAPAAEARVPALHRPPVGDVSSLDEARDRCWRPTSCGRHIRLDDAAASPLAPELRHRRVLSTVAPSWWEHASSHD